MTISLTPSCLFSYRFLQDWISYSSPSLRSIGHRGFFLLFFLFHLLSHMTSQRKKRLPRFWAHKISLRCPGKMRGFLMLPRRRKGTHTTQSALIRLFPTYARNKSRPKVYKCWRNFIHGECAREIGRQGSLLSRKSYSVFSSVE